MAKKKTTKRPTIAGDIRRIRNNILKPRESGFVTADFCELHKAFNEIEAKEVAYKDTMFAILSRAIKFAKFYLNVLNEKSDKGEPVSQNDLHELNKDLDVLIEINDSFFGGK